MRLLDQMAGVAIYSRQHLPEPPYQVQPGDTLERIAEALNVPALLLGGSTASAILKACGRAAS